MDPETDGPKHSGTLKKKSSIKRTGSKKSKAGSVRSLRQDETEHSKNSVFYTPVPTHSNPAEVLVNRFQAWRKVLKDFVTYFREVQAQYEARARGIQKLTQTLNSATHPNEFLQNGGILETNAVLRDFHKEATVNSEHAAKIELEVINNLVALRSDLNLKIKEIKALSPDFKNSVDKEKEATRKEVQKLQEALQAFDSDPTGRKDPYIIKLGLERQLRRQIQEENYLHKAYLNLESSGRELEKIVVGEIQKAYGVYVRIIARDGQELLGLAERLTASTLRLPLDHEWSAFVERDSQIVGPSVALRSVEEIEYPGRRNPAVVVVRSGMLERKSKYLKSFTPAWYVLSPTHLHEFKSSDRNRDLTPVMSLCLPESSLGKYSDPTAISHKFALKARQTGSLHRDHNWVFRAESHQAMLEWYEAIKKLTEVSGAERTAFVVQATSPHKRTASDSSRRADSFSSENGIDNDDADEIPYSGQHSTTEDDPAIYGDDPLEPPRRPDVGRFPSDIQVNRDLELRHSDDSSGSAVAAISALPGAPYPDNNGYHGREDDACVDAHYDAYTGNCGTHDSRALERGYVVVPPLNRRQRDSPFPWSEEKHPENETPRNVAAYTKATFVPVPVQKRRPSSPKQGILASQEAGVGIDPLDGVQRSRTEHILHPQPNLDAHTAFLETDMATRSDPDADPREPIPQVEADQVAIDLGSLDAVADSLPTVGGVGPSVVDGPAPVYGEANYASADYTVREADRPQAPCGNPMGAISGATVSNLHIPGEYPKKT